MQIDKAMRWENKMDTRVFTNMTILGPGIWFTMHIEAIAAITDDLKQAFVRNINYLCDNFKCETCKTHFRKFIDTHPFHLYWKINHRGNDIGFFKWTWELHNKVNAFLKKYQPSLDEAYSYYTSNGVCTDCGDKDISHFSDIIQPVAPKMVTQPNIIPSILDQYLANLVTPKPLQPLKPLQEIPIPDYPLRREDNYVGPLSITNTTRSFDSFHSLSNPYPVYTQNQEFRQ